MRAVKATQSTKRCAFCGDEIRGAGVERKGKRFCQSWHAGFYRAPRPWWQRIFQQPTGEAGGGGNCCG